MASLFKSPLPGVHVPHRKNTKDSATEKLPLPDLVYITMAQHMGPPCNVTVKPMDLVKVGQVIGDSEAFLSAPIHSSVSGKVTKIDDMMMPNGSRSKVVIIETDKEQTLHEDIRPPVINSHADFVAAIKSSGMVGLGGAAFPTHIKFNPKNLDQIDSLVINAAECEPYITADYRTMIEDGKSVVEGIKAIMKWLGIKNCYIGIEDNKPEAIKKMTELTKDTSGVKVCTLKSQYPQGGEKVLIYETIGRVVGEGKLPGDVGAIVVNVTSCAKIADYLKDGVPLTKKRLTVDGGAITTPKNVETVIGTPISSIIEFCGGFKQDPRKIIMGGPMMGAAVCDTTYPVTKGSNAVLCFDASQVDEFKDTACIKCGRCVRACPFNLMPLRYEDAYNRDDNTMLEKYKVNLCMECGCCSFACPAKRPLVQVNRLAKARLRAAALKK